jgi:acylphosphatase
MNPRSRRAGSLFAFAALLAVSLPTPARADDKPDPSAPPTPALVRQAVERSLPFLEKDGVEWLETKKCASCHAVPMTVWSLSEARQRGFAVNQKALDEVKARALAEYAGHPQFKPVGQDGKGDGLSRNTIYLSLAAAVLPAPDTATGEALDKFAAHLLATQQPNGSWTANPGQPPVVDADDVTTMWALLALAGREQSGATKDAWPAARDRALAWLQETQGSDSNQALVLRVLVRQRFGKAEEVRPLVKQLLEQQHADGGWGQIKDRASDALATGQALFALAAAGSARDEAVQRAWGFLLKTQRDDGSWLVPTRVAKGHDVIISYNGSGWATVGLVRTLPAATARLVHYSGTVQGVGFRATAADIARGYPVTGWVKNLADGRVQLLAEGDEDAVEKFLGAVRDHWRTNITKEQTEKQAASGTFKSFEVVR